MNTWLTELALGLIESIYEPIHWAIRSISFFNTIAPIWLGLTLLLNAERRRFGTWVAGSGLILAGLFFAGHTAVISREVGSFDAEMEFWWRVGWLPFLSAPYLWYLLIAWYAGVLGRGLHRLVPAVLGLIGLIGLALLVIGPWPTYGELRAGPHDSPPLPQMTTFLLAYPVFSTICIVLSFVAIVRPEGSDRFMGDLARRRARPWLVGTGLMLLAVSLSAGVVATQVLQAAERRVLDYIERPALSLLLTADLVITGLVAVALVFIGRAIVSYEIFTGKALPRGGLLRQWRVSLVLAAGFGIVMGGSLALPISPIYQVLLATVMMTAFYALLGWQAYSERERGIDRLRPFVASQHLYEQLLRPVSGPELDAATPFGALCEEILTARVAYLVTVGPLAPLIEPVLSYPSSVASRQPPSWLPHLLSWSKVAALPSTICLSVDPSRYGGAVWAVPLWGVRGLIGVLLLGEKRDGGLYTQEEIEIARAAGERLIDTRASAELARRVMALQRQRLAESQVLDRQARRVLHDEVLPELHAALLTLTGAMPGQLPSEAGDGPLGAATATPGGTTMVPGRAATSGNAGERSAVTLLLLTAAHRRIADLLQAMPLAVTADIARLGLITALRQAVEREFADAFDEVRWSIEPAGATAAAQLPSLAAEVIFHAAREVIRNAARYGRGTTPGRPLALTMTVADQDGLVVIIEDNGVGLTGGSVVANSQSSVANGQPSVANGHSPAANGAAPPSGEAEPPEGGGGPLRGGAGQGLALHSTMMAIIGGTLTIDSLPGRMTRVQLAAPR